MTIENLASLSGVSSFSRTTPTKRVALFAATLWEMEAVRVALAADTHQCLDGTIARIARIGCREYWLAQTGIGPEKARRAAARLLAYLPFSLAISTGFACALIPTTVGALLLGRDVLGQGKRGSGEMPLEVPGEERETVIQLATESGDAAHVGRFVSTERVISSAVDKRRLADETGAIGLDMESAALADEAHRAQVPFVIVRTVSDLVDEDLPVDFDLFLRPSGWLKGVASVMGRPARVAELWRLRRQSRTAADNLTRFFRRYVASDG
ncbi:MAG: hypothetical protein NZM29_04925 [Nitrospira sp.]|nr:hypothetical protein [Nitrospira sp.]